MRNARFALGLAGVIAVASLAAGCKKGGGNRGGKPVIVASIYPVYDLTRRVAGDAAHVELLLAPGREVHDFNPTTKDAKRVAGAKLAFIIGLDLDEWTKKILEASGGGAAVVELGERVETKRFQVTRVGDGGDHDKDGDDHGDHDKDGDDHGDHDKDGDDHGDHGDDHGDHDKGGDDHGDHGDHGGDHDDHDGDDEKADADVSPKPGADDHADDHAKPAAGHGHHHAVDADDPHVWLSVPIAIEMVGIIEAELSKALPDQASTFAANAKTLIAELEALDGEIRAETKSFSKKAFVSFHGSFSYFAAEYGLEIAAVIEPYPGKEPSPAYLREVLAAIAKKPVGALYTEPQLSARPAEVLAKEAKLELGVLDPVGGLEGRESYAATMRFNLKSLAKSLK